MAQYQMLSPPVTAGYWELLFWEAELGAEEDLGRPAPGQGHEAQQPWRKDTGVKTHEGPKLIHE
jgi:hypothetical protein